MKEQVAFLPSSQPLDERVVFMLARKDDDSLQGVSRSCHEETYISPAMCYKGSHSYSIKLTGLLSPRIWQTGSSRKREGILCEIDLPAISQEINLECGVEFLSRVRCVAEVAHESRFMGRHLCLFSLTI
jgi:hypothetical protein